MLKGRRFESDTDVKIVMVPAVDHGFFADELHWLFCQWAACFCADEDCFKQLLLLQPEQISCELASYKRFFLP